MKLCNPWCHRARHWLEPTPIITPHQTSPILPPWRRPIPSSRKHPIPSPQLLLHQRIHRICSTYPRQHQPTLQQIILIIPFFLSTISPDTLTKILWVFYNPKLSIYEASYKDWTTILGFVVKWGFPEIEELVLRELNTFPEHHESHDLYQEIVDQLDDFRRAMHQDTMRAVHRHLEDDHNP